MSETLAPRDALDLRQLRDAFGRFATGVTVITTKGPSGPLGFTANSFTSVSLDPPLLLWCPAKASSRAAAFTDGTPFAVHVLGADQHAIGAGFAKSGAAFDGLPWHAACDGTPLIDGTLARFHCTTHATHDAGDHVIVIGRIQAVTHKDGRPLVFSAGTYGGFTHP